MIHRRKSVILILLALMFVSLLSAAVWFLSRSEYLTDLALQQVEQAFGQTIEIGEANFFLFPYPQVELSQVVIRNTEGAAPYLKAKRIGLDLRIFPLLRQKVVAKRLGIDRPQVELRRGQGGDWAFAASSKNGKESQQTVLQSLFFIHEVVVSDGRVTLIDESDPDRVQMMVLDDVAVELSTKREASQTAVNFSAGIEAGRARSLLSLVGRVEQATTEAGLSQFPPESFFRRMKFLGRVDTTNVDLHRVAEFLANYDVPSDVYGLADFHGRITVKPGMVGFDAVLSDVNAKVDELSFSGAINMSGLMTDNPAIALKIASSAFTLQRLADLVPGSWFSPQFETTLANGEIGATVEILDATVTGSTRADVGFSVVGEFRVEKGYLMFGEGLPAAQDLSGTIVLEPDRVRLLDFTGAYDAIPARIQKGLVTFRESGPWMEVVVEGTVAATKLSPLLSPFVGSGRPTGSFGSLQALGGVGDLTLGFSGPLDDPKEIAFDGGNYIAQGVRLQFPGITEPLSDVTGKVSFSKGAVRFDQVVGWINRSQVKIQGTIDIRRETNRFENVLIQAKLDAGELANQWADLQGAGVAVRGFIGTDITVSGPVRAPSIKGQLDLLDAELYIPHVLRKADGVPGSLKFDMRMRGKATTLVERLELVILPFSLSGSGAVQFGEQGGVKAKLSTGPIYLGLLPEGLTIGSGVIKSGILEVSLGVAGRGKDWREWRTEGWIAMTDGTLVADGLDYPLTNLFLRLQLEQDVAKLKRLEFRIQESQARLTGAIKNWKTKPDITLALESPQFDIDLLIPKGERSPVRDVLEAVAANARVSGQARFDRAWYKELKFRNLVGSIRIQDSKVTLEQIRGESDREKSDTGKIAGRLFAHLPQGKPALVRTSVRMKGISLEQFQRSLEGEELLEERLITGELSGRATLQGHGRDPKGILPTLEGETEFTVNQGRIRKGTIVPKVLAILNLPTLLQGKVDLAKDGLPFEKLTATLSLKNGMLSSENMILDSPVVKMTGAGNYNIDNDQLNVVLAVSPFGSYSDLLKKIPLFGMLLAGERQSFDTALFEAKGSLHNPDVTYLPLESLSSGLTGLAQLSFDILKNTVMLPADLLKSNSESSDSEDDIDSFEIEEPSEPKASSVP